MIAEKQSFVMSRSGDCVLRLDPVIANDIVTRSLQRLQLPITEPNMHRANGRPTKECGWKHDEKERVIFSKITVRSVISDIVIF